jgi:predicted transcriptional regulator
MARTSATLTLPRELASGLDEIAARTGRSLTEVASEAVASYLELQQWQIEGIEEAIREADANEPGIAHERIVAWVASWNKEDELPPPEPS